MKVNASSQTVSAILMCAWLAAGCAHTHRDTSVRELFAKIQIGMSRSQVLMARGVPPPHRTPSLKDATWTYWQDHWNTIAVYFAGDKVERVGR